MCPKAPIKEGLVSLPEEPEQAGKRRSSHLKTVGTVTKTYLQCGCDYIERAEFVARDSSCKQSSPNLALAESMRLSCVPEHASI